MKTNRKQHAFPRRFATMLIVLTCTALLLGACGKKAPPVPPAAATMINASVYAPSSMEGVSPS